MRVEREITIVAPPEAVYEVVADAHRLEDWVTVHAGLEDAPTGLLEVGAELSQKLKVGGQKFKVRWRVVEAERPSRLVWAGQGPVRSKASAEYLLAPDGDGGTHFSYAMEFKAPGGPLGSVVDRMVAPMAGKEADATLAKLKALLEA